MNANEENKRGANELNVEELEEIAGGITTAHPRVCPRCNRTVLAMGWVMLCPYCKEEGVDSLMERI